MGEHEYASVAQLKGSVSQANVDDPLAFARSNYMQMLVNFTSHTGADPGLSPDVIPRHLPGTLLRSQRVCRLCRKARDGRAVRPCMRSSRQLPMDLEAIEMARWEAFRQCPGCGFDFASGDGERSCSWGDCPYLPEELNVFCDQCRFNFFTMEGNPPCDDPLTCAHAAEPRSHVENLRTWEGSGRLRA